MLGLRRKRTNLHEKYDYPRLRQQLVKYRTMQTNGLRGLLAEYGEVVAKGQASLDKGMSAILARVSERLPAFLIDTLRAAVRPGRAPPTNCLVCLELTRQRS